ncbi:MAG TPA: hypothetical protein VK996_14650 [Ramlibacter sp.]|nr:hypothetical protein [Ramlibacter sp.]
MADCEGKACYERVYDTRKSTVITVGGVAVANLAAAVKTAAEAAITAKASAPKVVGCGDGCECVRNGLADTAFGVWKVRPVKTTVVVAGQNLAVDGTIERRSKKTKQGDCEDPNELASFVPDEWNAVAVATRKTAPGPRQKRT